MPPASKIKFPETFNEAAEPPKVLVQKQPDGKVALVATTADGHVIGVIANTNMIVPGATGAAAVEGLDRPIDAMNRLVPQPNIDLHAWAEKLKQPLLEQELRQEMDKRRRAELAEAATQAGQARALDELMPSWKEQTPLLASLD